MNLRQLELFVAVVERGNLTRTAEALQISQPAVSARLHALEQELGEKLFDYVGRRLSLTTAGRELHRHAEQILRAVADAERAIVSLRELGHGSLRVAATSTIGTYTLPPLLATFQQSHPRLQLTLEILNEQQALESLRQEQVDLALLGFDQPESDLVAEPLFHNELWFIAAASHPLAGQRAISFEQLSSYPLVVREIGSGTRHVVEQLFQKQQCLPQIALELRQNAVIKQAVMAGLGIAMLSPHGCASELASGSLVRLAVVGTPVRRDWQLVMRRGGELPPAAAAFCQQLRDLAQTHADFM